MGETGVPAPVRGFIASHIVSVVQLEVLLLLRAAADKDWTIDEVARALVTQPEAAAGWLDNLTESGLAVCFLGLTLNNLLLFVDKVVATDADLSLWRTIPALAGMLALIVGLLWEETHA